MKEWFYLYISRAYRGLEWHSRESVGSINFERGGGVLLIERFLFTKTSSWTSTTFCVKISVIGIHARVLLFRFIDEHVVTRYIFAECFHNLLSTEASVVVCVLQAVFLRDVKGGCVSTSHVHSILLEVRPCTDAILSSTTGHLVHGLFLSLIRHCDMHLNARLHNGPSPRPFTLSGLLGGQMREEQLFLQRNVSCAIRVTLLDGGEIWSRLATYFLEHEQVTCRLGSAEFLLSRMVSTPSPHLPYWVGSADWHQLASLPPQHYVTCFFRSPTAFSNGDREYGLYPQPLRVWESLLRIWNTYVPESLRIEKNRLRQALFNQEVIVTHCDLQTQTLHYPYSLQKGCVGTCTYRIQSSEDVASDLTALAALAPYSGLGYKTTMGMGQVQTTFSKDASPSLEEEVQ